MSKKLVIATSITLIVGVISISLHAASASAEGNITNKSAPTAQTTPSDEKDNIKLTKDLWLKSMDPLLPSFICKGFIADASLKKSMDNIKMTYEQCVSSIPEISNKCQAKIYDQIPAEIDHDSASTWGRALGECIGRNFAEQYLLQK